MTINSQLFVRTDGPRLVVGLDNQPLVLRGIGLGGWMSQENFITGYAANESAMKTAVRQTIGPDNAAVFFDRLLEVFFTAEDAKLVAASGLNAIRIPLHYQHFEDDTNPFVIKPEGFEVLDRVVQACADQGIYSILEVHSAPGCQNQRWHCDNPTATAFFWQFSHFQDRLVNLWEAIADHYRDNPWVAGYNLLNEPGDPSREVVGPFTKRLAAAVRAADPHHLMLLDGNTYSTEFDIFDGFEDANVIFACHDYAAAGFGDGGRYPGFTRGQWVDKEQLIAKFLERSAFSRQTNTPIWVGEFGPVYKDDPVLDAERRQILEDQLEIYRTHQVSWSIWTYKDVGLQGLAYLKPDSAYMSRFGAFIAKKRRLSADSWGGDGIGPVDVTEPFQEMMRREFPDFNPYPWGMWDYTKTLLLNVTIAGAMVQEYADLFRGLSQADLLELADSFALANCQVRQPLQAQLLADLAS